MFRVKNSEGNTMEGKGSSEEESGQGTNETPRYFLLVSLLFLSTRPALIHDVC